MGDPSLGTCLRLIEILRDLSSMPDLDRLLGRIIQAAGEISEAEVASS